MHRLTVVYGEPADREQFEQHYRERHLPLVAVVPGLRRFTTCHPRPLGEDAPYLVAELWFEDEAALATALDSPELATAAQDAAAMDVASLRQTVGEVVEQPI